jgi:acetolactate synthase-1/2/3 large subunit
VLDETAPDVPWLRRACRPGDFVHQAHRRVDLILNVGTDVIEKPPFFMKQGGTEVIHISTKTAEVDPVYFPQIEVIGDIANAIWQIKNDIVPSGSVEFRRDAPRRKGGSRAHQSHVRRHALPDLPGLPGQAECREAMPGDGIICLDNGVYKIWFARNYLARQPNTVLLDNALATMGAGLPSAMASAMVYPDRKVMAICGDGGFMMNSQEWRPRYG